MHRQAGLMPLFMSVSQVRARPGPCCFCYTGGSSHENSRVTPRMMRGGDINTEIAAACQTTCTAHTVAAAKHSTMHNDAPRRLIRLRQAYGTELRAGLPVGLYAPSVWLKVQLWVLAGDSALDGIAHRLLDVLLRSHDQFAYVGLSHQCQVTCSTELR